MARGWAMSRELRANVEEYLRIRRALGFKLDDHGRDAPVVAVPLDRRPEPVVVGGPQRE